LLFGSGPTELIALLLNTDKKVGSTISARVIGALETLRSKGIVAFAGVGLVSAPQEAVNGSSLLRIARDRLTQGGSSKSEAIH
jgi:hypothetical protein